MKLPYESRREFGEVSVVVDFDNFDCVVSCPQPGPVLPVTRSRRFFSLDSIQTAYSVALGQKDVKHSADVARALRWAGEKLRERELLVRE